MPNPSPSTPQPNGDQSTRDLRERVVPELVPRVQNLHLDDDSQEKNRVQHRYKGVPLVTSLQSLDLVNDGQVPTDAEMLLLAKVRVCLGFMLKQKNRWSISDELAEPVQILQECEAMLTPQAEVRSEEGDRVTLLERAAGLFCKASNLFIAYRDGNYVSDLDKWNFFISMYDDVMELESELEPQPDTTLKSMELTELFGMHWYALKARLAVQDDLVPGSYVEDEEDEEGDFIRDEPYYS